MFGWPCSARNSAVSHIGTRSALVSRCMQLTVSAGMSTARAGFDLLYFNENLDNQFVTGLGKVDVTEENFLWTTEPALVVYKLVFL